MGDEDQQRGLTVLAAAREICDAHLPLGTTVVVAVSGGADSVGLLHTLSCARGDLSLVVAHVRHGLRDDQADHDAARHAAQQVGARFISAAVEVGEGAGPEDAARRARYPVLWDVVEQVGAAALAVGHTMDDQAETVLLRIARGTGVDGLGGMAVADRRRRGLLLRPLLGVRRAEVRALVAAEQTVEDPTNLDSDQRRSRARHEVLPALSRLHPSEADVVPLLARLADLASADVQLIDALIPPEVVARRGPAVIVPTAPRMPVPIPEGVREPVLRRVLRRGWVELGEGRQALSGALIDEILAMRPGQSRDVSGRVRVTRSAAAWTLDPNPDLVIPTRTVAVPGRVDIPEIGAALSVIRVEPGEPLEPAADIPWVDGPLTVAFRGPAGARGARHLLSAVPIGQRHLVPIICDADGRVLGIVPGSLAGVGCDAARIRLTLGPLR